MHVLSENYFTEVFMYHTETRSLTDNNTHHTGLHINSSTPHDNPAR